MHLYMYLHQRCVSTYITLPPAHQKRYMSSAFFWEITQPIVVIPCQLLRQGPTVCRICHNRHRNIPEERRSHLLRCGSMKSWKRCVSAEYAPRTHRATLVANILLYPPILVGLVPLLLEDFSILASEVSKVLRHLIIKIFGVFFATNIFVFTLH
jgi:hypothetical protein